MLCFQLPKLDIWLIARALISASNTNRRMIFNIDTILIKTRRHTPPESDLLNPVHCSWDLIYRDGYRKWIWKNLSKKNLCGADADILRQSDLATGGSQTNGTKLGGKGPQPVLSQLAFVPFFFLVYSWQQTNAIIQHQEPILFVWRSWAQVKKCTNTKLHCNIQKKTTYCSLHLNLSFQRNLMILFSP